MNFNLIPRVFLPILLITWLVTLTEQARREAHQDVDGNYSFVFKEPNQVFVLQCNRMNDNLTSDQRKEYFEEEISVVDRDVSIKLLQKNHFPFKWKPSTINNFVPKNAVVGGLDDNFFTNLFICRNGQDKTQIGMASLENRQCRTQFNGKIIQHDAFDLLINPDMVTYKWVTVLPESEMPNEAIWFFRLSRTKRHYISKPNSDTKEVFFTSKNVNRRANLTSVGTIRLVDLASLILTEPMFLVDTKISSTPEFVVELNHEDANETLFCNNGTPLDAGNAGINGLNELLRGYVIEMQFDEDPVSDGHGKTSDLGWRLYKKTLTTPLVWGWVSNWKGLILPVVGSFDNNKENPFICRCLDCKHTFDQNTGPELFSSIGYGNQSTGLCHLPVRRPSGIEVVIKSEFQFLKLRTLTSKYNWLKLQTILDVEILPETVRIIKVVTVLMEGKIFFIGRLELPNGTLAFGSVNHAFPELIFTHGQSTKDESLMTNVTLLTVL